jgi:hypothetical protein
MTNVDERLQTSAESEDEGGPIGIFPSWGWLYATVLVYSTLLIILLHILTVTLDFGTP